jgi:hypothetical protein
MPRPSYPPLFSRPSNIAHNKPSTTSWNCDILGGFSLRRPHTLRLYSVKCKDDWWIMNWKGFGTKRSRPSRGTVPAFTWRNWGKPWTNLNYDSRCANRDSNRAPPEYKPRALSIHSLLGDMILIVGLRTIMLLIWGLLSKMFSVWSTALRW